MSESAFDPTTATVDAWPSEAQIDGALVTDSLPNAGDHASFLRKLSSAHIANQLWLIELYESTTAAANRVVVRATGGDDTTEIESALATLVGDSPYGGILEFPDPEYQVNGCVLADVCVHLRGRGGISSSYSSGDFMRPATIFRVTGNGPGVTITGTDSIGSSVCGIGFIGDGTGANQTGLLVDNRGTWGDDVSFANMGGDGCIIADCVGYRWGQIWTVRNGQATSGGRAGVGIRFGIENATMASPAVTASDFGFIVALSNEGDGVFLGDNVWGITIAGVGESNGQGVSGGYGIVGDTTGGSFLCLSNVFENWWDESNVTGSARWFDGNCIDNEVYFRRLSSAVPVSSNFRNYWSGKDLNQTGDGQRPSWQYPRIRGARLNSSDIEWTVFRSADDLSDGNTRMQSLWLTFGLTADPDDDATDLAVPQSAADALHLAHGRGLTWRNSANSGNIQGVALGADVTDALSLKATQGVVVAASGSKVGFYGTTPITKPAVTGSRGGNAALASLLTTLANLGLITDSTTA